MNGRAWHLFWSVSIVVAYSIALFWLGAYVEYNQNRVNIPKENRVMLQENAVMLLDNARVNEEILKLLRECRVPQTQQTR